MRTLLWRLLFGLLRAFGVSLADLVDAATATQRISVIRNDDATAIFRDDKVCRIRTLSPLNLEKDVEFYELRLKVGQRLKSAGHFSGTREFLTIQTGTVKIESGGESLTMKKGDSGHYIADIDHVIENIGKSEAVIFLVDIYASDR